jgi:hypothetical protein
MCESLLSKFVTPRNEALLIIFFGGKNGDDILFSIGFVALERHIQVSRYIRTAQLKQVLPANTYRP